MVGTDRLKIHEIFRVLIGDSADEWRSQKQVTDYCTDWEWADHLLITHRRFCNNDRCKLAQLHITKYDDDEEDSDNCLPVLKPVMNPYPLKITETTDNHSKSDIHLLSNIRTSHATQPPKKSIKVEVDESSTYMDTSHDINQPITLFTTKMYSAPRKNRRKMARTFRSAPVIDSEGIADCSSDENLPSAFTNNCVADGTMLPEGEVVVTVIPRGPDSDSDAETTRGPQGRRCQEPRLYIATQHDSDGTDKDCSDLDAWEVVENQLENHYLPSSHSACTCFLCGRVFTSMTNLKAHLRDHNNAKPGGQTGKHVSSVSIASKLGINRARKSFPSSKPRIIDFRSAVGELNNSCKTPTYTNSMINMPKLSSLLTGMEVPAKTEFNHRVDVQTAPKGPFVTGDSKLATAFNSDRTDAASDADSPSEVTTTAQTHESNGESAEITNTPSLRLIHKRIGSPVKMVKRVVKSVNSLKRHAIACKVCDKTFANESSRNSHLRTHSTERPFPCEFCHMAFNHRSNLKRHIRTHTGEKPWACSVCGKKFTRASSVTDHMKLHSGLATPAEVVKLF